MTISQKLYASFGAALAFTMILGVTSWIALTRISDQIKVSSGHSHKLELAGKVVALTSDMLSLDRGMAVRTFSKEPAVVEEYNAKFREDATERQGILKEYEILTTSEANRQRIREILSSDAQTMEVQDQLYRLATAGDGRGAAALLKGTIAPRAKLTQASVNAIEQVTAGLVAEIAVKNQSTATTSVWLIGTMVLLSLGLGAVVIYVVRGINTVLGQAVVELSEGAEQIASASSQVSSSSQPWRREHRSKRLRSKRPQRRRKRSIPWRRRTRQTRPPWPRWLAIPRRSSWTRTASLAR